MSRRTRVPYGGGQPRVRFVNREIDAPVMATWRGMAWPKPRQTSRDYDCREAPLTLIAGGGIICCGCGEIVLTWGTHGKEERCEEFLESYPYLCQYAKRMYSKEGERRPGETLQAPQISSTPRICSERLVTLESNHKVSCFFPSRIALDSA